MMPSEHALGVRAEPGNGLPERQRAGSSLTFQLTRFPPSINFRIDAVIGSYIR